MEVSEWRKYTDTYNYTYAQPLLRYGKKERPDSGGTTRRGGLLVNFFIPLFKILPVTTPGNLIPVQQKLLNVFADFQKYCILDSRAQMAAEAQDPTGDQFEVKLHLFFDIFCQGQCAVIMRHLLFWSRLYEKDPSNPVTSVRVSIMRYPGASMIKEAGAVTIKRKAMSFSMKNTMRDRDWHAALAEAYKNLAQAIDTVSRHQAAGHAIDDKLRSTGEKPIKTFLTELLKLAPWTTVSIKARFFNGSTEVTMSNAATLFTPIPQGVLLRWAFRAIVEDTNPK
jgi:hypothetical protein